MAVSAADPDDMHDFVTKAARALRDLDSAQTRVTSLRAAFFPRGTQGVADDSAEAALRTYLSDGTALDAATKTIRANFVSADSTGGTVSVDDSIIAASLAAKGQAIPSEPPRTVESPHLTGQPVSSGVSDDPVNVANGNFFEPETDLTMPGRAGAIAWVRTYNSRMATTVGALGHGWTCWADSALVPAAVGLHWTQPDGKVLTLPAPEPGESADLGVDLGSISADLGVDLGSISADTDGGHIVTLTAAGEEWTFTPDGRPVSRRDRHSEILLSWEDDQLVTLTHPRSGRSVTIGWGGHGRIDTATSSDGRIVSYEYDEAGHLVAADAPATGLRRYEVTDGLLAAVTDADGIVEVRNTYDADGRVETQLSPDGRLSRYTYRPGLLTVVTDSDGRAANGYQHDLEGRLIALTDGAGNTVRREFDAAGNLIAVTSRGGLRFASTYDDQGHPTSHSSPDGSARTMSWDAQGRLVTVVDRTGRETRFTYRADLRTPVSMSDAAGTTTYEVDDDDLVTRVVDPDGVAADFAWDADGQLTDMRTATGTVRLLRDAAGHTVGVEAPGGMSARWDVDAAGRVLRQTDPNGFVISMTRSAAGRPLEVVDAGGGRTETSWGSNGQVAAVTDPLGSVLRFAYDTFGNTTGVTAPDGREITCRYDELSRPIALTDPAGGTTTRSYDADGEVAAITTPTGASIRRTYDVMGLPREVSTPLGDTARNEHDAEGRLVRQTAVDGSVAALTYDEAGRIDTVTDGEGARAVVEWTPGGRLAALVTPAGGRADYRYDAGGQLVAIDWPSGARETFDRDGLGRITARRLDDRLVEALEYDPYGNVVAVENDRGRTAITRDAYGQPLEIIDGNGVTRYERDVRGSITACTDGRGARVDVRYDECGRQLAAVGPLGGAWHYAYDAVGRPIARTDPAGRSQRLERDADGNVVARVDADGAGTRWTIVGSSGIVAAGPAAGGGPGERFDLDGLGRVTTATGPHGALQLDPTLAGDLRSLVTPDGVLRWEHDANGNIVGVAVDDGAQARFDYDAGGGVVGLDGVDLPEADPTPPWAFERDAAGQLVRAEQATGDSLVLTWQWDAGGRLIQESGPRGTRSYTYDDAGQLVRSLDDSGTTSYRYDDAGRRVEESGDDGAEVRYRWDDRGRLAAVERRSPEGGTDTTELSYDALGMVRRVGGRRVIGDPNAPGGPVRVVDGDLVLPVGPGVVRLGPDGAQVPVDAAPRDPWGLPIAPEAPAPAFGPHGELSVGNLLLLGDRVLDPQTRAFLSPDALDVDLDRPGIENVYAYAYNDPTRWYDPTGRKPVTEAALTAYWKKQASGHLDVVLETAAVVGELALGTVLVTTGFGTTVGAGLLIGAGGSLVMGLATGHFDPKQAMIAGAMGGLAGAAGPAAGLIGVEGLTGTAALGATVGAGVEGGGYVVKQELTGEPVTWKGFGAAAGGGAIAGGAGALSGPIGGGVDRAVLSKGTTVAVNAAGGGADSAVNDYINTGHVSAGNVVLGGVEGAGGGELGDRLGNHIGEGTGPYVHQHDATQTVHYKYGPNERRTVFVVDSQGTPTPETRYLNPQGHQQAVVTSAVTAGAVTTTVETGKDATSHTPGGQG